MDLVRAFSGKKVIVAGDIMLDEYLKGEVSRISPEAPVPIVEIKERMFVPGGAGNVAANIVSLGGEALLCGVAGKDEQGTRLLGSLNDTDVSTSGVLLDDARLTTTKTRIVAHNQQIVRVDQEKREPLKPEVVCKMLQWIEDNIVKADACILSDYGKGVVSPAFARKYIELAKAWKKPLVVDPKGLDFSRYSGATVITPNSGEAEKAANCEIDNGNSLDEIWNRLRLVLGGTSLLITRGAQGMSLYREKSLPKHIPSQARHVFDVTGAGDTVVSTLALSLAAGISLESSAEIANLAAGVVVGKLGTAKATALELVENVKNVSAGMLTVAQMA